MKIIKKERKNILDYEKEIKHELEVIERDSTFHNTNGHYYAMFKGSEVTDGTILSGTFGDGFTPTEAIKDYCKAISEKRIVFNAFDDKKREEFTVPILYYE